MIWGRQDAIDSHLSQPVTRISEYILALLVMRWTETYSEIFIVLTLGYIEMSHYRMSRFTPTLPSKSNTSKSLMNIFPARIGPTVCELLGPTIRRGEGF